MGGNRRGQRSGRTRRGGSRRAGRKEEEGILIYGVHPVEEYVALGGRIERAWATGSSAVEALLERHERLEQRTERVSRERLEALEEELDVRGTTQGIMVRGGAYEYADFGALCEGLSAKREATIVALDGVQDVGNLGAILRNAAAFEIDAVIVPWDRAAGVTGAVIRASAGQALRVPVARVTNLARALDELKERAGCWVYGTVLGERQSAASRAPWEVDLRGVKAVWVLGGEQGGVRRLVGEKCDVGVVIPMAPGVESLNVASAASVVMYETRRQRATEEVKAEEE